MMLGERLYVRALSRHDNVSRPNERSWQYHPRSDAHSKAIVLAFLIDLLRECPLLCEHVAQGRAGVGINHRMQDFRLGRNKRLDLVVCKPGENCQTIGLVDLAGRYGLSLSEAEAASVAELPSPRLASVASALVAIEAKACMTEHQKARPRLYDELSSSYQTINGDTNSAIAAAHVTINVSDVFASPSRNPDSNSSDLVFNNHRQPEASQGVLDKVAELRRRPGPDESGFDAIGITLVDFRNDGSEARLVAPGERFRLPASLDYEHMVNRVAQQYASRFARL